MPRKPHFPSYPKKPHKTGQARVRVNGRDVYLGVHGSPDSWAEYDLLLGEWRAGRLTQRTPVPGQARTVADVGAAYLAHLRERCKPAHELEHAGAALKPLARLLGDVPPQDLRARRLEAALREAARAAGWSRGYANRILSRWKRCFRWADKEELVPAGTYAALAAAEGLGHGEAPEHEEVPPAPEHLVEAVLPHLDPVVRALVECLRLTGARPDELCRLRPCDIDRSGEVELARGYRVALGAGVWAVQPRRHKTSRKGKRRVVLIGPKAQAVLAPLLEGRPPDRPVFCPREAAHAKLTGPRPAGERYNHHSLRHALCRACAQAFPPPPHLARLRVKDSRRWRAETNAEWKARLGPEGWRQLTDWRRAYQFHPYQLRHSAGTNLAAEFGLPVATLVLGHSDPRTTGLYALPDLRRAAEAMEKAG